MKKLILIMALVLSGSIAMLAQDQQTESVDVSDKTTRSIEQILENIDGTLQDILGKVESTVVTSDEGSSFDMLDFSEDVIIPLVAITLIFGMPVFIVLIVFVFRHKEKKRKYQLAERALAAGKDIPIELFEKPIAKADTKARGITNAFLGLGLGIFLWALTGELGLGCIGFMIMLVGIGQIIIHYTSSKSERRDRFSDNYNKDNEYTPFSTRVKENNESVSRDENSAE